MNEAHTNMMCVFQALSICIPRLGYQEIVADIFSQACSPVEGKKKGEDKQSMAAGSNVKDRNAVQSNRECLDGVFDHSFLILL
jgi:hypothetical protein